MIAKEPPTPQDSPTPLVGLTEVIPSRLYFASLSDHPQSTDTKKFFTIDYDLRYEPFFADFGPMHLGDLTKFCKALEAHLAALQSGAAIVFYTSHHGHQRANAGCLIACFCVVVLRMTPAAAWNLFSRAYPPFLPFRDASFGVSTFNITIYDCLCGLHRAAQFGWYDVHKFDVESYEKYHSIPGGDWNWIVPDRVIAFGSPVDGSQEQSVGRLLKPFHAADVQLVVRLNERMYDKTPFTRVGIRHVELPVADGGTPTSATCLRFLELCEQSPGTIAVHCQAGLGRTGTMIGLYAMKHFGFTAKEFIAWCRLCRPGSVVGAQQHFLEKMQSRMFRAGESHRRDKKLPPLAIEATLDQSLLRVEIDKKLFRDPTTAGAHPMKLKFASSRTINLRKTQMEATKNAFRGRLSPVLRASSTTPAGDGSASLGALSLARHGDASASEIRSRGNTLVGSPVDVLHGLLRSRSDSPSDVTLMAPWKTPMRVVG